MAPLAGPGGAGDFASPGPLSSFPMGARKASEEEEAILVTVRVRPLSPQELAERDVAVWRCTDEKTLTFADNVERSPYPSAYIFDRVFGPVASSEQVYAEAARDLVQSSLTGLNATVFAYGQTSSGKTHTMRAVSRSAVQDIFEHIQRTPQREFLIRVSALEIYNEVVRDLLRPDSGPLRLLDDPERGTVVERLAEEVVRSSGHLYQILEDCEAQRQVGETMLNDNSSRSHQIIRLSVESCPSIEDGRVTGAGGSSHVLMSVLNFVDLAGSERASQTLAEGARLKEGGHINRSLLTLGTVIRKLGESNKLRRGHIPYRDSKLTRILQHSLGGNARTAIICTMSPARAHVEQTRNTLSFATRAKEVTNSAHINLVVSDKVLIKRLQREVSRLEAELAVSANPRELQARDIRIQQIEMQLHELVRQRDAAQAQARELTKAMLKFERGEDGSQKATKSWSPDTVKKLLRRSGKKKKSRLAGGPEEGSVESAPLFATSASRFLEYKEMRERRKERQREREREREAEAHLLDGEKRKLETMQEQLGQGADLAMQALQKEIECLRLAQAQAVVGGAKSEDIAGMIDKLQAELAGLQAAQRATALEGALPEDELEGAGPVGGRASAVNASMERMIQLLRDELARLQSATKADEKADQEISALEEKLESAQLSLDKFYDGAGGDEPLLSSGRRVLAPRSPGGANF